MRAQEQTIDLSVARQRLRNLRARRRDLCAIAVALLVGTGALAAIASYGWAGSCGVGAAVALLLAGQSAGDRRRLLTRLVAQGDAQLLPEVQEFSRWLLSAKERARLVRALRSAAAAGCGDSAAEYTVILPERAEAIAGRLRRIADRIGDSTVPVSALGLALCRRLLFDAASSPLLNPKLGAGEAERAVVTIEAKLDRG